MNYKLRPKFDRLRERIAQGCQGNVLLMLTPGDIERVRCAAYICTGGEIKMVHDLGYTDLDHVFVLRPRNCQYSVLELACGDVLLVNMYELNTVQYMTPRGPYGELKLTLPDHATDVFPSVDAAIMYAVTVHE